MLLITNLLTRLTEAKFQSDFVRYGGLWLDTDFIIFDNLFNLIRNNERLLTKEYPGKIGCVIILAKAKTEMLTHAVKRVNDILSSGATLEWNDLGPVTVAELYKSFSDKIILIGWQLDSGRKNIQLSYYWNTDNLFTRHIPIF